MQIDRQPRTSESKQQTMTKLLRFFLSLAPKKRVLVVSCDTSRDKTEQLVGVSSSTFEILLNSKKWVWHHKNLSDTRQTEPTTVDYMILRAVPNSIVNPESSPALKPYYKEVVTMVGHALLQDLSLDYSPVLPTATAVGLLQRNGTALHCTAWCCWQAVQKLDLIQPTISLLRPQSSQALKPYY